MAAELDDAHVSERVRTFGFTAAPDPDIASAAARIGHYVWLSARLYEITGGWATTSVEATHKIHFAGASSRFAWQAHEWQQRLPRLREVDDRRLIRPAQNESAGELDRLAAVPTPGRLAALAVSIVGLDELYRTHAEAASPLRDGPFLRSSARIRADLARLSGEISDIGHSIGQTDVTFPKA